MTKCIEMGMIYANRSLAHHNSTVIEDELQEIDRRMMMMMMKINREVIVTTINRFDYAVVVIDVVSCNFCGSDDIYTYNNCTYCKLKDLNLSLIGRLGSCYRSDGSLRIDYLSCP